MRDTISLLLATSVLALGGLGLYFYKSNDSKRGDRYDEDEIFGDSDNENTNFNEDEYDHDHDDEDYEKKNKKRSGKTKRTKKTSGTKRRY